MDRLDCLCGRGLHLQHLTPDCAQGTFVSVPFSVELSYAIETGVGREFSTVTYSYADPRAPGDQVIHTAVIETS